MYRPRSLALTSLLALAACADAATAPPRTPDTRAAAEAADDPSGITRTDLQALGFTETAVDINDAGVVVGGCRERAGNYETDAGRDLSRPVGPTQGLVAGQRALRWSPADGVSDLGTLGGDASCAAAVNGAGQVVGYSRAADGQTHAFVWADGSGMRDLGTLAGDTQSRALDINAGGEIVGWSALGNRRRAVRWAPGGPAELVDVTPAPGQSRATGINDSGWIVGFFSPDFVPFTVDQSQFLTTPAGGGRLFAIRAVQGAFPSAINNRGVIVGGINSTGDYLPMVLNDFTGAPRAPRGCELGSSYATLTGITDAGVVTQSCSSSLETRAVVNVPGEAAARRLPAPLLGEFSYPQPRSAYANAVNDAGQVVGSLNSAVGPAAVATLWSVPGLPAATGAPAPTPTPAVARLRADPAVGPYRVSEKACGGRFTVCLRFAIAEGVGPYRVSINWAHYMAPGVGPTLVNYTIPSAGVPLLAPHDYTAPSQYLNGQVVVTVTAEDSRGAPSLQQIILQLAP